eukprot:g30808.t1
MEGQQDGNAARPGEGEAVRIIDQALHDAARDGRADEVKRLCEGKADADLRNWATGNSPLSMAARNGHLGAVQELLRGGAHLDCADRGGTTALHWAALYGHHEVVAQLLQARADSTLRNQWGETALDKAHQLGSTQCAQLLDEARRRRWVSTDTLQQQLQAACPLPGVLCALVVEYHGADCFATVHVHEPPACALL